MTNKERLVVLGAGPMGLAVAYRAAKQGYAVDLLEADDRPGGMAAHFDFDGLSIERFYHFCCLSDANTLEMLDELGMCGAIKWVSTEMGYFIDGRLIRWGDPLALALAPGIGLATKFRYGLHMYLATKRRDWRALDRISAREWLVAGVGRAGYDRLWRRLLELKFFEYADDISAAWIWKRIQRLGASRSSPFTERLGYIEGGSETLVAAMARAIERRGGRIHYSARARRFLISNGRAVGVEASHGSIFRASNIVSTIPTPYIPDLFENRYAELRVPYRRIRNIGVVCVVHKLQRSVSRNFWVNIGDPRIDIPGFVEFSNLRNMESHVVYVPYYMPHSHEKYDRPNSAFVEEIFGYLREVNPGILPEHRIASHVGRLRHAQPVCDVGFSERIPDNITPISGLQIADTCFYYPEDRGISESLRYAKILVDSIPRARRAPAP